MSSKSKTIDQSAFLEHVLLALSLVLIYAAAQYAIKRINIEKTALISLRGTPCLNSVYKRASNNRGVPFAADAGIVVTALTATATIATILYATTTPALLANPLEPYITFAGSHTSWLNTIPRLLATFIASIIVGVLVHEFAHAVVAAREGFPVEQTGVVLLGGLIPIGAGVELPDKIVIDEMIPKRSVVRILSAGIFSNIALAAIAVIVLYSPITPDPSAVVGFYFTSGYSTPLADAAFWFFVANIHMALFNALPIPVTDGGHILHVLTRDIELEMLDLVPRTVALMFTTVFLYPHIS